jgi:hypothetical protein
MEVGPEDMLEFGIYYLPSLVFAVLTSVAILVAVIFGKKLRPKFAHYLALFLCLVPAPLVCWVIYFASTSELTFTLTMLGSERSQAEEHAYDNRFKMQVTTVDAAVGLAVDQHQESNVRFYASCLIADMLVTNGDAAVQNVLKKVDDALIVNTEFFGGNRLTDQFYIPGRDQVHLPVRDIIEQRLRVLRKGRRP